MIDDSDLRHERVNIILRIIAIPILNSNTDTNFDNKNLEKKQLPYKNEDPRFGFAGTRS